jgi:PAS domain S-box-containing protein
MVKLNRHLKNYGVAIAVIFLATGLMLVLDPYSELTKSPFLLFFGATTISAWYGGRGPGLVATALSALLSNYFFLEPLFTLSLNLASGIRMALFILQCGLISVLVGSLRLAQYQTKASLRQLEASESKFRRLVDSNIIGIISCDIYGAVTDANDAFLNSMGYSREDLWAGRIRWDQMTPEDLRERDIPAYEELIRKGKNTAYEKAFIGKQGQRVPIVVGAALLEDAPDQIISFILDVSERKRAEQRLAVQYAIARALAEATTVDEAIALVLQSLGESLAWQAVFFWRVDGKTNTLRYGHGWHGPDLDATTLLRLKQSTTFTPGLGLPGQILATGKSAWVANLAEASNFPRKAVLLEAGLHSVLGFPVAIDHEMLGVIECFSTVYQEPDDDLRRLMDAIGSQIGQFMDRKQTEEELQASQVLFQSFMNYSPFSAFIKDEAGHYLYVNPQVERAFNRTLADYSGKTDFDLFPLATAQTIRANDLEVLQSGQMIQLTESVPYDQGEYHYLSLKFPLQDAEGRTLLAGMSIDISDRKRFEAEREQLLQQLEASLGQLEAVVGSMTEGLLIADGQGRMLQFNPAALAIHGYESLEQVQQPLCQFYDLFEGSSLQGVAIPLEQWPMARALRGETFSNWEIQVTRVDTGKTWIGSYSGTSVRNKQGEIILAIVTTHDVTAQHQTQAEIARSLAAEKVARTEAEAANRVKDEFLAVLSHELRTPLNPILGWVSLLQSGALSAEKTALALETIERNAKLQTQLIDDLLDISRILQGKLTLDLRPIDLATVIKAAQETVQLAVEAKAIGIQTHLDPLTPPVKGDFNRLQQVVWNLLSNAVKFTPDQGQIDIGLSYGNAMAHLTVKDNGKGIAPTFLPHIFEYFRQADTSTTRTFGGLGLGLAIARQIVNLHGGTIQADSPGPDLGATFTVSLPLLVEATVPPTPSTGTPTQTEALPLATLRILAVDDEPDNLDLVEFILTQAGATVAISTSATQALQQIEAFHPDVLVTDLGMPEMDGYTLLEKIKHLCAQRAAQGEPLPLPKAIALTAFAGDANQQKVLQAGFQRHLAKPVEPQMLIDAIAALTSPPPD